MQRNLYEYLEQTAVRMGDAPAFSCKTEEVTFSALLRRSMAIGTVLAKEVAVYNRPVAILAQRTPTTITAMMSALASGNYYALLDDQMPLARMEKLVERMQPCALLYSGKDAALAEKVAQNCPRLCVEELWDGAADEALLRCRRGKVLDVDPAYLLFTSGSTGEPKGIVVSHRSVIDFADWYVPTMGITHEDVLGNQAPFFFDLSVKDVYTTLKTGARTYILPKTCFSFPMLLIKELNEQKVTTLSWATSAFHMVANTGIFEKQVPQYLRRVILGGEALRAKQLNIWRKAMPQVQYVNLYGPTEVTVDCCYYIIKKEFADNEPIPIGIACENKEVLLLTEEGKLAPKGQPGEICVRGTGLAQGYFGAWEKTNEVFTQNPLNPWYPDRLYHTGDIAVEDEDGQFVFCARKDSQIKHGGYRIELGEVETAVSGLDSVREAICLFDAQRDRIVCIYQGTADGREMATALQALLPKYMIPNIFVAKDALPHTPNGKIDRVALRKEYDETH